MADTEFDDNQVLVDAVTNLLDTALIAHPNPQSDEVFEECTLCGGWEEHKTIAGLPCPVPALEAWLDEPMRPPTPKP